MQKPSKILLLGLGALTIGQARTGNEVHKTLNWLFSIFHGMPAEKIVHFWELPQTTRFGLKDSFRKELFSQASKTGTSDLAKAIGISLPCLSPLKRGVYSMPIAMVSKLSDLSGISLHEIEKKIVFIRTRHGGKCTIGFPLAGNPVIASLVGHAFGDGYISKSKRQFEYINFNNLLLKKVDAEVSSLFGASPISEKADSTTFPAIVGDLLVIFGAPISPKLMSQSCIPDWIMGGPAEIKKEFLRAIFDDDGSAMFSEGYRAKGVSLSWTRHENNKQALQTLLLQVKELLSEFKIYSGEPKIAKSVEYPDGKHLTMYINITDIRRIRNFHDAIGLENGSKLITLEKILARKYSYSKSAHEDFLQVIVEKINAMQPVSTAALSKDLKLSAKTIIKKLKRLESAGMIEVAGRVSLNRSKIWKIAGGEALG